jgi:hypothetical protein
MKLHRVILIAVALCLLLPGLAWAQEEGYAPGGGGPPPGPPPPDPKAVRTLRLRFEREPTVEEVQQAALKFFKVHPEKVASYRRGAAWKALMPDLELIFNNEYGTNDRTLFDYMYKSKYASGDWPSKDDERVKRASLSLGVRAHWSLDRLIFNAETLDVSSLVGVQEGLLREITSLYFTRRRLMTAMVLNPPQSPNEQITEQLRLDEITANLDALTGGFFSKQAKKRLEGGE